MPWKAILIELDLSFSARKDIEMLSNCPLPLTK